jgi:CubicO group peptidase (beta-lactamase class C family)
MGITRRPLLLGALGSAFAGAAFAQNSGFEGEWNGTLQAGGATLRLHLVIAAGPQAILFSVDQGNARIPASSAAINGDQINLAFAAVNATFVGRLANGRIEGSFTQGQTFPLAFERGAAPAAPPPIPVVALTPEVLRGLREQCGSPALAAAAAKLNGGRIALVDGVRSTVATTLVTVQDRWHLGSITKSMTATLVARCVEAGAVSWDDTVGGVLGAAVPEMRADYRDVNFRHLLSHRAGLKANIEMEDFMRFPRENADPRSDRTAYARLALQQPPEGPKEETFLYSNSGFVIAGAMLEAKLGAKWEDLIRTRLFEPLGMTSAGFGAPGAPGAFDQPVGHARGPDGALIAFAPGGPVTDNPAVLGPAGRAHASFDDVLTYLAAHRDRTQFLRTESWSMLHTPPFGGDYAMGWIKRGDALWHNGSNTLWYAEVAFNSAQGVVAVAAANCGDMGRVSPAVGAALHGAVSAVA